MTSNKQQNWFSKFLKILFILWNYNHPSYKTQPLHIMLKSATPQRPTITFESAPVTRSASQRVGNSVTPHLLCTYIYAHAYHRFSLAFSEVAGGGGSLFTAISFPRRLLFPRWRSCTSSRCRLLTRDASRGAESRKRSEFLEGGVARAPAHGYSPAADSGLSTSDTSIPTG